MLQDRDIAIDEFIKFTSGGVNIADYDQIQSAIIRRYKEVYGSDIDLANTTADGVFVNDLALIINNILQSFKILYSNLDVNTASGVYLDNLCRLSNVRRKTATQSTAQLQISSSTTTSLASGTKFVDSTGNTWTYSGQTITISANATPVQIVVTCDTYGAIEASAGSIYQTLVATDLIVTQNSDAAVGLEDESDADLRARRAQSTGSTGTTVLQSLVGALLDINGIEDVQVINNNTDSNSLATDTSTIKAHSVYIIVRQAENLTIDSDVIGEIIYNKLTPGISTNEFTGNAANGESKSYSAVLDENINWLTQTIYWKQAKAIHPQCSVTITPLIHYTTDTAELISNAVITYLNNIKLSKNPEQNDMIVNAMFADPTFKGAPTYVVKSVDLTSVPTNLNTYYHYTTSTVTQSGDDYVITFA